MTNSKPSARLMEKIAEMENLSAYALDELNSAKADAGKVVASFSQTKRIVLENSEFTLAQTIGAEGLSLVAYKEHKKGSSSINTTEKKLIQKAVLDAVSLTNFGVADEYLNLADTVKAPSAKPLDFLFDEQVEVLEMEALASLATESMKVFERHPRLALDRCEFSSNISFGSFYNSNGVRQKEIQTQVNWSFFGMARDGEQVTGFDYDGGASFHWDGVKKNVSEMAESFAEKLIKSLNPVSCPSYLGPVLLSPRAVEEILLPFILFHASGTTIMDGKSRWQNALGEKVASQYLTLTDNPHCNYLAGASAFDRDGIPTSMKNIIEGGELKSFLYDCYSAKKLNVESNGFAGGPFGLHMAPGSSSLAEMFAAQPNLLVVDRFSGNSDPIKGDISGVAKSSRLYSHGKDVGAVTETMIAGNLFEMLKNILKVSRETAVVSSDGVYPYVLIDQISVTGNA